MNTNKLVYLLLIVICYSCHSNTNTEKHQDKRDKIVNVREKITEIKIDDVLIGQAAGLSLMDDYLIISDSRSLDKLIHLFDKNKFKYLTSIGDRGQGPGEITNMGHIEADAAKRLFYVNDHGKQTIFSYELDSVLVNQNYMPKVKMKMNKKQFPDRYQYINDTLSVGLIIEPIGNSDFKPCVAKWNMNTGEIKPMKYEHPDIEKKRISFAVSMENGIYVECYSNHDLMTIAGLEGDLKCNIYGPDWSSQQERNKIHYYGKVIFCNNKILATYSGGDYYSEEYHPTKFLVFDINGDYIKTLETGYFISDYCYDKANNRILMVLDDEKQFAYLDLDKNLLEK